MGIRRGPDHDEQSTGGNDALPRLAYVPDGHGIELFPAVQRRDFCAVFDRDGRVRREAAGELIRHRGGK